MAVELLVEDQDVVEIRTRGQLVRTVFLASYSVGLRARLAAGVPVTEAERESMREAETIARATFPGWPFDLGAETG